MTVIKNLEVPIGPYGQKQESAYNPAELHVSLTPTERKTLRRIVGGCQESGTTLASGRKVESGNDALAWILEAIAAAPVKEISDACG